MNNIRPHTAVLVVAILSSTVPAHAGLDPMASLSGAITNQLHRSIGTSTDRSLVEIQYLAPKNMKVVRESRCDPYVDMTLSAMRIQATNPSTQAARQERILQSLSEGWRAGCYVAKTPEESLPAGLRTFWEVRHARLSSSSGCAGYVNRSTAIVYGRGSEDERQFELSKLYVEASKHGCYR